MSTIYHLNPLTKEFKVYEDHGFNSHENHHTRQNIYLSFTDVLEELELLRKAYLKSKKHE
jgi:hypothetical protein